MKTISTQSAIKLITIAAALGCLLLATGCGKKEDNKPAPIPGVSAETEATLSTLTTAARKYAKEKQQIPASLDQLVSAGYLQSIPAASAGKKFVLDSRRVIVVLADQ